MRRAKSSVIIAMSSFLIGVAVLFTLKSPLLTGVGIGVYKYYFGAWVLLLLSILPILYGILKHKLRWTIVVGFGVLFVNAILVFSYLWGFPQGSDVLTHILYSDSTYLVSLNNPYPAIHSITLVLTSLFDVSKLIIYVHGISIISSFSAIASAMIFKSSCHNRRFAQVAYIVALPMWAFQAVFKPLTLSLPFLLFVIWIYINEDLKNKRHLVVGMILLSVFHIQIVILAVVFIGIHIMLSTVDSLNSQEVFGTKTYPFHDLILFVTLSTSVGLYILVYDPILESILSSMISVGAGTEVSAEVGKQSAIQRLFANPQVIVEAIARTLYGLLLVTVSGWALLSGIRKKRIYQWEVTTMLVAGFVLVIGLLADIKLNSYVISAHRIEAFMLPFFLVFLTVRAFKQPAIRTVAIAFLLVTAGVFGLYESPMKGTVTVTPSQQDIHTVNWVSNHRGTQSVVSTNHFAQIIAGLYPRAIIDWARPEVNTLQAKGSVPLWEINDSDSLYLLGARETATVRRLAIEEKNPTQLNRLRNFRNSSHTIYSSGRNTVHRRSFN